MKQPQKNGITAEEFQKITLEAFRDSLSSKLKATRNVSEKKNIFAEMIAKYPNLTFSGTFGSGTNANYKILKRYLPPNERHSRPALKVLLTRKRSTKIYYVHFNKAPQK